MQGFEELSEQEALAAIHRVRQGDPWAVMAFRLALMSIDNHRMLADLMEFVYHAAQREVELHEAECNGK